MIRTVTIRSFKCFREQVFELDDAVVLAGPNNAGKSTLLQAITTWRLGLDRWIAQRKGESGSKAVKRTGVSITRSDFTSVPLREMNHLWEDRRLSVEGMGGKPRLIEIIVEGRQNGVSWDCGLEFQYANAELIYVRPLDARNLSREEILNFPCAEAQDLNIVHIPPLSGIDRDEPRRERGMQDLLIGQGRPGEILRNLLWEIAPKDSFGADWEDLAGHMETLFGVHMSQPKYSPAQPFITCEYRQRDGARPLDLCNAGSGMLQVLLLLAFIYARPASAILLDEPDAHQHIILQKRVYDLVRQVARARGGQVIIASHSEVILDATEPERVLAFIGGDPRRLADKRQRDQLREALKVIPVTDLLLAMQAGAVLYVESAADDRILAEWARVLGHPAHSFFDRPFVSRLGGRNLRDAKRHFFALQLAVPGIRGLCLVDGDNRDEPDDLSDASFPRVLRWRRYEIENYLLHPAAIHRFVGNPLMTRHVVEEAFWGHVPIGTDLIGNHVALERTKASTEFLIPLMERLGMGMSKQDLYQLAAVMKPEEIHPEVTEKLDQIAERLTPARPGP